MNEPGPWRKSIRVEPGECLQSIAIRLAPWGPVTVAELLQLGLGLDKRQLAILPERDEAVRRLALIGGFDLDDLKSRCWRRTDRSIFVLGRELPEDWLVTDRRRIAPGRLAKDQDSPWIRMLWQLRAFPCDPETGELLIDRCECGTALLWANAETVWGCQKCGRDVRSRTPKSVPPETAKLAKELASFFGVGQRPSLPKPFDGLSDRAIFAAMNWFGYFVDLEKYLRPGAANAMEGYRALKRWPVPFDRALAAAKKTKSYRDPTLISDVIMCIQRTGEPEVEAILRQRAAEFLGVPTASSSPTDSHSRLSDRYRLRTAYHGHREIYLKFKIPLSQQTAMRKARSSRR
jgi:hypothetical protein